MQSGDVCEQECKAKRKLFKKLTKIRGRTNCTLIPLSKIKYHLVYKHPV